MPAPHTPEDVAATFCATLIDEWFHHGVRQAVVAPGSRSTAMALALAERSDIQLHVFHDERAAAFAALGIGLLGTPAVLLCTSGTAAAHFHAAVIEADLSAVPMLVCTADRPPELRDVGAPQTIDQTKLYGSSVRWFHDPGVADLAAAHTWRSMAAHAFAASTGAWPGPVHLNLPFREPLIGRTTSLPGRVPTPLTGVTMLSTSSADEHSVLALASVMTTARGVIVAGRRCGSPVAVRALALATGWPVLADARSGLRHDVDVAVSAADALLRAPGFAAAHRPDVVVRLGEPPVSKVLNQWLAALDVPHVHVSATPTWTDPDGVISHRIVADPSEICIQLAHRLAPLDRAWIDPAWIDGWIRAEVIAQRIMTETLADGELTEPAVARHVVAAMSSGSNLVVSSSMPIRDVEWYGVVPEGVKVFSNRGANGIDGVIATSIGVAAATGAPTTVLIGDVAFLHDSSALTGVVRRGLDVRIVVVDNDGGGIFSFLPQAAALDDDRFELLFGTPHRVDLAGLGAAHGLTPAVAKDAEGLRRELSLTGPSLTVVRSERGANVHVHVAIHAAVAAALTGG